MILSPSITIARLNLCRYQIGLAFKIDKGHKRLEPLVYLLTNQQNRISTKGGQKQQPRLTQIDGGQQSIQGIMEFDATPGRQTTINLPQASIGIIKFRNLAGRDHIGLL